MKRRRHDYVAGYRELLSLTMGQREELKRWAESRTLPAGDVFRARLILALADGRTYAAIKQSLRTTAPAVSRWKQRFEAFGIDGLELSIDSGVGSPRSGASAFAGRSGTEIRDSHHNSEILRIRARREHF
jgi:hypothetical protein